MRGFKERASRLWRSITPTGTSGKEVKSKIPQPPRITHLEIVESLVQEMKFDWASDYRQTNGFGVHVTTLYQTLDTYVKALHEHTDLLHNTQQVNEVMVRQTLITVPINRFFLSHDGYYTDLQFTLFAFAEAILNFCKSLRDTETAPSGSYNVRLLTPMLKNLQEILTDLAEIEQQMVQS